MTLKDIIFNNKYTELLESIFDLQRVLTYTSITLLIVTLDTPWNIELFKGCYVTVNVLNCISSSVSSQLPFPFPPWLHLSILISYS